jgi:hypothetical protein
MVTKLLGQKRPKGGAGFRYKGSKDIFFVDSYEIWQEGESIKGDLDAIIFNHIDSTILKG